MDEKNEINHSDIPIRLFQSDFLEFFTHVHPTVIIVLWTPVIILLFLWGYLAHPVGAAWASLGIEFLVGLILWTFVEYNIHRFFFHFCPKTAWQERIIFLFHGVHHAQPRMKTRLVMPPAASLPMAAIFLLFLYLFVGRLMGHIEWVGPLLSGLLLGYLIYDLMHYASHHFPMRKGRYFRFLKRHHMLHHYKTPDQRFGVSSPFWDWVYGTWPKN